MFAWWRRWREARILRRTRIDQATWAYAFDALPLLAGFDAEDRAALQKLAILWVHDKSVDPVGGLQLGDRDVLILALQAALPILHLGLDWYGSWYSVVLYPGEFARAREEFDDHGVAHHHDAVLSGEAWGQGGVYLSWADVRASGRCDGYNVVIHELAHKLDMRNGAPDGFPPLHPDMAVAEWTDAFRAAFDDMQHRYQHGEHLPIDPYALTNEAECFAVFSEYFFEQPVLLRREYPAVYTQLSRFYRQDPHARLAGLEFPAHPTH